MKTKPKPTEVSRERLTLPPIQPTANLQIYALPDEYPGWRWMLLIALGLTLLYFVTARPLPQTDSAARSSFALTSALATERSAAIDHFARSASGFFLSNPADFPNAAYYQGHYYSDAAPGTSLLALPFYQFGQIIGEWWWPGSNAPVEAFGLLAMALAGAGTVLLLYAVARRLGATEISARYGALTLGLASALWREAGRFGPPIISLLLLTAALLVALPKLPRQILVEGKKSERLNLWQGGWLGLLLGLAVTVDYPNLIWTPLFVFYLIWAGRLQFNAVAGLGIGWLVGIGGLVLYNGLIFGVPWAFTYGHLLNDAEERSLTGQFLGGFNLDNLRQAFFGDGRAVLGPFLVLLGTWGLAALWGQRGKRKEAVLLVSLIAVSFILGLLRHPIGEGMARVDFIAGVMPPLALGVAVWHQRFQFLTRLEQTWLVYLALWGVIVYYLIAPPGPGFNNLGGLVYILPFIGAGLVIGLIWWTMRGIRQQTKARALSGGIILFTLVSLAVTQPNFFWQNFQPNEANNLFANTPLQCQGQKLPGWYLSEPCRSNPSGVGLGANARLQPYLIGVQGGNVYNYKMSADAATNLSLTWSWSDEGHNPLPGEFTRSWNDTKALSDKRAAPPGAAYLQLTIQNGSQPASLRQAVFWNDNPQLEPMKNYATSALSFSFDWESAMGGLIHSKGGASFVGEGGETGGVAINEGNRQRAIANAEERGQMMRDGADNLLKFFQQFDIRGTFYATGYNLLDGNPSRIFFAGNPTYKWADSQNRWDNDYWKTHPWYGDDPYGTYKTNPAWYFGDQTDRLKQAGQDIQSHTFGHLYVRGTSPAEFAVDVAEWIKYARAKGIEPRSFAFPWQSSNSVKEQHYKVLADNGFLSVTRLYDVDQAKQPDAEGVLKYDNGKRDPNNRTIYEAEAGPQNFYYYLNRVKYEPRLLVLNDYQLVPGNKSEAQAKTLVDQLLLRRGYGSIWTHPEAVVDPGDKSQWLRVIAYAAAKRESGLWIDSVTNLVQHRLDIQKIGLETSYSDNGKRVYLTLTNHNTHSVDGLTLTMPAPITRMTLANGQSYTEYKGNQFVAPKLGVGQSVTLVIYL